MKRFGKTSKSSPEAGRSAEFEAYLAGLRRTARKVKAWQVFLLVALVVIWQIAADLGLIDSFITSTPLRAAQTIYRLAKSGDLFNHLWITVMETVIGFTFGTVAGTLAAMALWWAPVAARIADPYLVILNALPKVAFGPLIIVWAGAGIQSILIMTLMISLISTILQVYSGFMQTDEQQVTLLRSFGASKRQMLFKVILPASYDNIVSAFKINIGLSWVGVIMGEFLVSKAGLGYLIVYGRNVFNLNLVMASIIVLSIAAALMYFGVSALEKRIGKHFHS
jgi:NitT/TauT family transport system permease protein